MLSRLSLLLYSFKFNCCFLLAVSLWNQAAFAELITYEKSISGGRIRFLRESNQSPEEFSRSSYHFKPDPAALERKLPLLAQELAALQFEDFAGFTQEEIDQIYLRLPTGFLQTGDYEGKILIRIPFSSHLKNLSFAASLGVPPLKRICQSKDLLECLLSVVWAARKIRIAEAGTDEMLASSSLNPDWIGRSLGRLGLENSGQEDLELGNMFPARIYCGQSLYDHRRESHIIDHAWGKDFKSPLSRLDSLVGPRFLNLREEFRMVRTDLFLGRVYANKAFLTNIISKRKSSTVDTQASGQREGSICNRE